MSPILPERLAPLNRRRFLQWTGLLGFVSLVGWQAWGRRALPGAGPTPRAFTPPQLRTLALACAVALDDEEAGRTAAADLDVYFAGIGASQVADLALALTLLEFAPRGLTQPRRFSRCSLVEAAEVLEAWERSGLAPRRQIAKALRDAARFTWFAREETWAALGYEGTWVGAR